eukprot:m.357306 g.357306  ORF g.357306 m.357306 type:complete len:141 (-) comp17783_c0_seq1:556-978(-)
MSYAVATNKRTKQPAAMRVDQTMFLSQLSELFRLAKERGDADAATVRITTKRVRVGQTVKNVRRVKAEKSGKAAKKCHGTETYACLYRAALGAKKFSTEVKLDELEAFQKDYSTLLRACMRNLQRKKSKAAKAAAAASQS